MDRMRNNREAIATAVLGVAATGSVALLTLYLSKKKQQAIRRASVSCYCGNFKAEIYQPAANYKYAETISMQCGCHDCVGACKAVCRYFVFTTKSILLRFQDFFQWLIQISDTSFSFRF